MAKGKKKEEKKKREHFGVCENCPQELFCDDEMVTIEDGGGYLCMKCADELQAEGEVDEGGVILSVTETEALDEIEYFQVFVRGRGLVWMLLNDILYLDPLKAQEAAMISEYDQVRIGSVRLPR